MIKTIIAVSILLLSCSVVKASSSDEFHQLDRYVSNVYKTTIIADKDMIFSEEQNKNHRGQKEDVIKTQDVYKKWRDILNSRKP